jgi:hypothetical protein
MPGLTGFGIGGVEKSYLSAILLTYLLSGLLSSNGMLLAVCHVANPTFDIYSIVRLSPLHTALSNLIRSIT